MADESHLMSAALAFLGPRTGRLILSARGSWRAASDAALRELAVELGPLLPDVSVLLESEYQILVDAAAIQIAPALLIMPLAQLEPTLDAFAKEFPAYYVNHSAGLKRRALDIDLARRTVDFRRLPDTQARAEFLNQTAADYGAIRDDAGRADPRFVLLSDWESRRDYEVLFRIAMAVDQKVVSEVPRPPSPPAASAIASTAEAVLHVTLDIGGPALAGAVASRVVDASLKWVRDRLKPDRREGARSASKEDERTTTVQIYSPGGGILREIQVASRGDIRDRQAPPT